MGNDKGRPNHVQALWFTAQHTIFRGCWCPPKIRVPSLRALGGSRVRIRRGVRVQWPWKLTSGEDCWASEGGWLLNLEPTTIEYDVCVSQGALLCIGAHVTHGATFEYDNGPIVLKSSSWVCARAILPKEVTVGEDAVASVGQVARAGVPGGKMLVRPNLLLDRSR